MRINRELLVLIDRKRLTTNMLWIISWSWWRQFVAIEGWQPGHAT